MKFFLVAFAQRDRLMEPGDTEAPADGERIQDGDYVGYLFEDRNPDALLPPPEELHGGMVFLLQHMSSKCHDAQRSWLAKVQPRVWPLPLFMHEGEPKRQLRSLFVVKAKETLREVVGEFRLQQALDLLEQTLAWNALVQFLPDAGARDDAEDKRDSLAGKLKHSGVMEENLVSQGLKPDEWESRLRARVAEVAGLLRSA